MEAAVMVAVVKVVVTEVATVRAQIRIVRGSR